MENFDNVRVGDKVRITTNEALVFQSNQAMTKWCGREMTVREVNRCGHGKFDQWIRTEEDRRDNMFGRWYWFPQYVVSVEKVNVREKPIDTTDMLDFMRSFS